MKNFNLRLFITRIKLRWFSFIFYSYANVFNPFLVTKISNYVRVLLITFESLIRLILFNVLNHFRFYNFTTIITWFYYLFQLIYLHVIIKFRCLFFFAKFSLIFFSEWNSCFKPSHCLFILSSRNLITLIHGWFKITFSFYCFQFLFTSW